MYYWTDGTELYHHGIKGQKWGVQNGPPYPLNRKTHDGVGKSDNKRIRLQDIPVNKNLAEKAKKVYEGSVVASKATTPEEWDQVGPKANDDYVQMWNIINTKLLDYYNAKVIDPIIKQYADDLDSATEKHGDFLEKYWSRDSINNGFRTETNLQKLKRLQDIKNKKADQLVIAVINRLGLPNNSDSFEMVESCVFWD